MAYIIFDFVDDASHPMLQYRQQTTQTTVVLQKKFLNIHLNMLTVDIYFYLYIYINLHHN